ncbi:MAG: hypothetical protein JRF02_03450, partial [Deltaproteobacteria bacterium]|nr:hypothetical protein [Deltaproteobacteria bacterium]
SLDFFNPKTGKYESARSNPIPLKVNSTKVLTAKDAEGMLPVEGKSELASLDRGIAHNYVGGDILIDQQVAITPRLSSLLGLALLLFPPAAYLIVLVPVFLRRKRLLNDEALQAKRALPDFFREQAKLYKNMQQKSLEATAGGLVEAIRIYLGKRMMMPIGVLVFADVAERLKPLGVDETVLAELREILDWCEAYHYGGGDKNGNGQAGLDKILIKSKDVIEKIDRCFRS